MGQKKVCCRKKLAVFPVHKKIFVILAVETRPVKPWGKKNNYLFNRQKFDNSTIKRKKFVVDGRQKIIGQGSKLSVDVSHAAEQNGGSSSYEKCAG
jgi:hypothetical protein